MPSLQTREETHLVTERVTADHDRLHPPRDRFGDAVQHDGLPEHSSAQDVPNGAVRGLPHLLEVELLDAGFVWGDGRAFDADVVLEDGFRGVNGYLIVRL